VVEVKTTAPRAKPRDTECFMAIPGW